MLLAAVESTGIVGWRPHPEVWLLVAGAIAIGWYASRVIQPKAVAAGHAAITRGQKRWFVLAVLGLWLTSDWPIHDVAEEQLYVVHMAQHMMLSLILPAMFLLATPRWLLQLVIRPDGRVWQALRVASRPVFAGIVFNALTAALHFSGLVQLSLDSAAIHFALHLAVFAAGLLMWMPVCGPVEEWRLPPIGQILYLFLMSVLPTVPGGWLVFAEDVVYRGYDTPQRLFGLDALSDQQFAGAFMKLGGGFFLWMLIAVIFFKWAAREERQRQVDRRLRQEAFRTRRSVPPGADDEALTFEDVARAFAEAGPPPRAD